MASDLIQIVQAPSTLERFARILPKHIDAKRYMAFALSEFHKNPMLQTCEPQSVMLALSAAAQLGLDVRSGLGHCYLIPFKNGKTGNTDCNLIIGYKGLIHLARQSGQIKRLSAAVVCEGDAFEHMMGSEEYIKHRPCAKPGKVTHVYAVAEFINGHVQMEVMTREQIDGIKNRGRKNSVWDSDFTEMARKTVVRRLCKYLPLSPELQDALEKDQDEIDSPIRVNPEKINAIQMDEARAMAAEAKEKNENQLHEKAVVDMATEGERVESEGGNPYVIMGVPEDINWGTVVTPRILALTARLKAWKKPEGKS